MADAALKSHDFYGVQSSEALYENASVFAGKPVVDYKSGIGTEGVFRFRSEYEEDNFESNLREYLASDQADDTSALVIGVWTAIEEMIDVDAAAPINLLVEHKDRLKNLKALYLGDIVSEENEMSWIQQSDLSPLLEHFPSLEYLRSRGSEKLQLSRPQHDNLRALALETGGLEVSVLRSICTSKLPNLEHLELWLGTEDYNGNCTVQDLQPILSGTVFPKLKYLGLRNYEHIDEVCGVIVSSPVLRQLEVLDLSFGVLTDVGARALLNLPRDTDLNRLVLNYHYMTAELVDQLQKLPFTVEAAEVQQPDDEWRYVAVGE